MLVICSASFSELFLVWSLQDKVFERHVFILKFDAIYFHTRNKMLTFRIENYKNRKKNNGTFLELHAVTSLREYCFYIVA